MSSSEDQQLEAIRRRYRNARYALPGGRPVPPPPPLGPERDRYVAALKSVRDSQRNTACIAALIALALTEALIGDHSPTGVTLCYVAAGALACVLVWQRLRVHRFRLYLAAMSDG